MAASINKVAPDKSKYVYELNYSARKELCNILDLNDAWEPLGGKYLGFNVHDLHHFKQAILRNASPTDEMLRAWEIQNHTILELYLHLSCLQHYQAMTVLKPHVPSSYHGILDGEPNLSFLPNDEDQPKCSNGGMVQLKRLEIGSHNINNNDKVTRLEPSSSSKKIINSSPSGSENNQIKGAMSDPLREALEGHIPLITYGELEEATGGWDSKNLLGKGGFGMVFKGTWKYTDVAIKRLEVQSNALDDKSKYQNQLLTELRSLYIFRHDNILPLYGFCVGGTHDCLIYQYMPNGSLEDKLLCRDGTNPLSWNDRHNIAIGIARGLQFLHTFSDTPLIHGDIKSANILLDSSLVPKIGDFGLAREGPAENYTYIKVSRVHGTKPYLPNEFLRDRKFSTKVDVYSYGIVLFEIASGLRAYDDKRRYKFLKDHIESVPDDKIHALSDPRITSDKKLSFTAFITLGKQCTDIKSKKRPEMVSVLKDLEHYLYSEEINCKLPYLLVNSARPSMQSDLPSARDRQVTASVRPLTPKSNSPVSPIPPQNNFNNGILMPPSSRVKSISPFQPIQNTSVGGASSSSDSFSGLYDTNPLNNASPVNETNNILDMQEPQLSSQSSVIPPLSFLLNKES